MLLNAIILLFIDCKEMMKDFHPTYIEDDTAPDPENTSYH